MTSSETFDPGVAQCGNTVLQSGTQSHTGVIFPQVRFSPPRENMSILIISTKTFSHSQTKGQSLFFCLTAHCFLSIWSYAEDQLSRKLFGQSMFFRSNLLLCCAGLNKITRGSPISCESAANGASTPSSISNKSSVTQAHRRLLIVCLPIIYQPPPSTFACLVSFYCPSV